MNNCITRLSTKTACIFFATRSRSPIRSWRVFFPRSLSGQNPYGLRLVSYFQMCVEDLSAKQAENVVEVRGPPTSKAFDDEGNPTKVLLSLLSILIKFLKLKETLHST